MIPTSAAYKQAMNGPRTFLVQVTVTFRDETVEVWDNSRLMSLSFEEATSDTGTFTVGSAIIGKLSLSVLNHDDAYSELDFIDAVMQVKIGVETANGTEYMNRGIFTVDTARADSGAILITALDNLSKMDIPYQTASKLTYPATLDQIYRDACTSCGVYPATVGFLNDDFVVQNRPTEDYTCREILSAVATMAGCFAKADRNGEIMLGWYDGLKELLSKEDYDGGTFDSGEPSYETGDSLDGGVFDNGSPYYASGDSVDGGSFSDMDDYFHLYSSASQEIDIDDIEITGVEVLITTESDGETTTNTYLFGEEGYLISISENPLIQVYDEDMLMAVANKLIGMRFRKFSMSGRSDPAYETGDSGYVSDRKGNSYISILTSISFEVNGYEGFTCDAESVLERNMTRYNETARNFTKVVQKTEQMVNEEKTARELAIEQLTNRVNNSSGLFTTIETQSDGSKIFKLHDKPTLEESQIVWTMTAEAWTVSTNGGETPNAGMTVDGDTIVRILTATGINADWINSGTIRAINIVGSTISGAEIVGGTIRTATIEGYVDDNTFNEEIETVLDSASSASTLANQAKSAADTANANANQASQMAEAVRRDLAVSGAVEINGGNIKSDTVNAMLVDAGVLVGLVISNGNGTFYVDAQGNLTASSADISGKIEADEGRIGSLVINSHGFKSNTVEIQDNPGDPLIWLTMALDGSWSRSNYEADAAIVRAYDQENSPTGWSCHMMSADRSFNSSGQMQLSPNPKVMFEYMDNGIASRRFLLDTMGLSYLNSDYSDYADAFFNIRFAGANIIFSSGDMFIQSSGGSTHVYINGTPY